MCSWQRAADLEGRADSGVELAPAVQLPCRGLTGRSFQRGPHGSAARVAGGRLRDVTEKGAWQSTLRT
eukprot:1268613-Pyramimonas_sp.AAC.1